MVLPSTPETVLVSNGSLILRLLAATYQHICIREGNTQSDLWYDAESWESWFTRVRLAGSGTKKAKRLTSKRKIKWRKFNFGGAGFTYSLEVLHVRFYNFVGANFEIKAFCVLLNVKFFNGSATLVKILLHFMWNMAGQYLHRRSYSSEQKITPSDWYP